MMTTSILILIVAKALPSINKNISSLYFTRISSLILLISGLLSLNLLYIQSIGLGIGLYSGLYQITTISQTIDIFIFIIGSLILIGWPLNLSKYAKDYSLIILFSILGSSLLISSLDLMSFYLSLELQSFGLYILATLYRNSEASTNAGLKYFLLGGLSSCIILLGAGILYSYTGLTQLESINMLLLSSDHQYLIIGSLFGIILIVLGLFFKISAAPLHNWSPDVYDDTPTIVTIYLTIIPKIALLILLLEIYTQLNITNLFIESNNLISASGNGFINNSIIELGLIEKNGLSIKNLFLISSVLSLIIGTVVGLAQIKIKRLLAYSTISHIGFMLLALSINSTQSIDSFLFYLIQYIITNLNIFLILLAISYIWNKTKNPISNLNFTIIDIKYLRDLQGLFYFNPFLSLALSLSLFSMAGIPPFVGFFSKQFVLYSAIDSGYYFISILGIIVSVISASYYLKIIRLLHIKPAINQSGFNILSLHSLPKLRVNIGLLPYGSEVENINNNSNNLDINSNNYYSFPLGPLNIESKGGENLNSPLLSQFHSLIISILSLFILLFILKPTLILNSTQVLSLTLFKL